MQVKKLLKFTPFIVVIVLLLGLKTQPTSQASWEPIKSSYDPVDKITIHLAGAVKKPGLYTIPRSFRLKDTLDVAGGPLERANMDKVNLAQFPKEGQRVYIPYKKIEKKSKRTKKKEITPVSINHGSLTDLQQLPYIGEKTAQRIIDYREKNGGFKRIDELMKVKGIGEKTMERIKVYCKL